MATNRIDTITDLIDQALADPGQHSPETSMYSDVAVAMPAVGRCWRCETAATADGSDLCAGCRAWLLEDTDIDPVRPSSSTGWSSLVGAPFANITGPLVGGGFGPVGVIPARATQAAAATQAEAEADAIRRSGLLWSPRTDAEHVSNALGLALISPPGAAVESVSFAYDLLRAITDPAFDGQPLTVLGFPIDRETARVLLTLTPDQLRVFGSELVESRWRSTAYWTEEGAALTESSAPMLWSESHLAGPTETAITWFEAERRLRAAGIPLSTATEH